MISLKNILIQRKQTKKKRNNNINEIESVLIIDDVITTGTTLNEAAKVIKEGGIKKVYRLCYC